MPTPPHPRPPRGFALLKIAITAFIIAGIGSNAAWYFATRSCTVECSRMADRIEQLERDRQKQNAETLALMTKVSALAEIAKAQQPPGVYIAIMDAMALYVKQGHSSSEIAAKFAELLATPQPRKD